MRFIIRSEKMHYWWIALLFSSRSANASSIFFFFSLTINDKTNISLTFKILHLRQGSFTRKVRTIFPLKIIVSIFVKIFLILVLHLRQFFIIRIFCEKGYWPFPSSSPFGYVLISDQLQYNVYNLYIVLNSFLLFLSHEKMLHFHKKCLFFWRECINFMFYMIGRMLNNCHF
jgi:hypothetical protein